jgi:catechol 2,3-dioxygenase-like lactoylglutathione lyase family enzyme
MRLRQTVLFVKDLELMAEFYGEVLGLEPVAGTRTGSWIEFEAGLALHAVPAHLAEQIEISSPPRPREDHPVKLIFHVDNLDAERARLAALGVTLMPRPWGVCDAIDPEGNIFQLNPL